MRKTAVVSTIRLAPIRAPDKYVLGPGTFLHHAGARHRLVYRRSPPLHVPIATDVVFGRGYTGAVDHAAAGVVVGTLAQTLIGISLVWDKVLLGQRETSSVVSYAFWLGFLSLTGVLVAPFGFVMPPWRTAVLGITAGVLHIIAVFFYYLGLKKAEASRALALMGGFYPLATALISIPLLGRNMVGQALEGFALLTAGGFVMFFADRFELEAVIPLAVVSAAASGLGNVLQKIVFNASGFVSGYVFFTIGSSAGSLLLLLRPSWRTQILRQARTISHSSRIRYLANRVLSGLGSILTYVAISQTHPALIDAIAGIRYVIVFAGTYLITRLRPQWLHEQFSRTAVVTKSIATALVIAGLAVVGLSAMRGKRAGTRPAGPALLVKQAGEIKAKDVLWAAMNSGGAFSRTYVMRQRKPAS